MIMKQAVLNATFLKEHADELQPRGPTVEVVFTEPGPVGMHIVNVPTKLPDGTSGPDRVVVAAAAEGSQAEHRLFFGEQVLQVGEMSTVGLRMKEVKLMIADAERPIRIVVQPLCRRSTRRTDFPLCPPVSEAYEDIPDVWGLMSRWYALEDIGPERQVLPKSFVEYVHLGPEYVFVKKPYEGLFVGDRIVEVDGKRGKGVLLGLLEAKYPGSKLVVQKVHVSGTKMCHKCQGKEWVFSKFCSRCGAPQTLRRVLS